MEITYSSDKIPTAREIIKLYDDAGLPRPTDDPERIQKMFENSDVVITARDQDTLVGISRSITDWVWSSYLADLAVSPNYQKLGIGKMLVDLTREKIGDEAMILLLSVPEAMEYYPRIGFKKEDRGFLIKRKR